MAWAAPALNQRWREEAQDRRVALAVEWNEFRDFNARLSLPDTTLLRDLRAHGVTAVVVNPISLAELVQQHRVQAAGPSLGVDPYDIARLRTSDPVLARQMLTQWTWQNVTGLELRAEGNSWILSRRGGGFAALKDADVGYDPQLINDLRAEGLTPIWRIYNDPWITGSNFTAWLKALPTQFAQAGVLFSSDDFPGGLSRIPFWRSWLKNQGVVQFLPEFKPAAAAMQMARALPALAFRAHSIPAAELKDLKPPQQIARWQRAVSERSCRLLLVRMAPGDSKDSFLAMTTTLSGLLSRQKWQATLPDPRLTWEAVRGQKLVRPMLAFGVVCITPLLALAWARLSRAPWRGAFLRVAFGCLVGALIAAAIAQTPFTRIQITPFRGIKAAFLFSWFGALVLLYSFQEVRSLLTQVVRRRDLVIGALAAAVLGYLLLRTGNAPAAWKPSWEQTFRNLLETLLIARPRFKEFAIGWPALWVGCYLESLYRERRIAFDPRPLVWIGMIGPISMINTFCHLHSPLAMELGRSFNGLVLGVILGTAAIALLRPWIFTPRRISYSLPREENALAYPRSSI